jgi:hypothetical protein
MWVLAHEMSLDNYGYVENDVFTSTFSLIQATDTSSKMAGVAALDALIEAPSADEEKKAIKFANNSVAVCDRRAVITVSFCGVQIARSYGCESH